MRACSRLGGGRKILTKNSTKMFLKGNGWMNHAQYDQKYAF